jgi:2-dehydropantoate 2-reductase
MRILVVGAGATGGYLGIRLAATGKDVTFLVREGRKAKIRADGLKIRSPLGDASVTPNLVTAREISSPFDLIILAVKAYQLEGALDDMDSAVGPETMILPVLNGMSHMDKIARRFSPQNLLGCSLIVATTIGADGQIEQLQPRQEFAYGEIDGSLSERMKVVDRVMQGAGVGARLSSDIAREMWEKWTFLASLGGLTCLMRGKIGQIASTPTGKDLAREFLLEVVTIIKAVGREPSPEFLSTVEKQLTDEHSALASSMFRDLNHGHSVEVDEIIGDLYRRGMDIGLSSPLLRAAYTHLRLYQDMLGHTEPDVIVNNPK